MTPNIFLTGASGYIGGDILHALSTANPTYAFTLLVRSKEKGAIISKAYPKARIVLGSLDDLSILEKESSKADIVIHTADASDHVNATKAIATGLLKGHSPTHPGYWLHTGGTGILTFTDSSLNRYGEPSGKIYDDWDHVQELISLPDDAFHRDVDQMVLECGTKYGDVVKTAIVCPPTIYGVGRGPCSGRGRQVYELARVTLELGRRPIIGKGLARWNNIHVFDLSAVFDLLASKAVAGDGSPRLWGEQGYYFTENGEHYWGELAALVAKIAKEKGLIEKGGTESMGVEEAKKHAGFESASWGMNSRGRAVRARELLGWTAKEGSIEDEVSRIVEGEWRRLKSKERG